MSNKTLKLWGKGHFKIMDFETIAYILTDGSPLLSKNKMDFATNEFLYKLFLVMEK